MIDQKLIDEARDLIDGSDDSPVWGLIHRLADALEEWHERALFNYKACEEAQEGEQAAISRAEASEARAERFRMALEAVRDNKYNTGINCDSSCKDEAREALGGGA